jgi:hypothetical protein
MENTTAFRLAGNNNLGISSGRPDISREIFKFVTIDLLQNIFFKLYRFYAPISRKCLSLNSLYECN